MPPVDRDRSLQDVLRARRQAASLLSVREVREREATRRREEEAAAEREAAALEAVRLVARWREGGDAYDARSRISTAVHAAVLKLDPEAYAAGAHWRRVARAQRAAAPLCEVERCDAVAKTVQRLEGAAAGEEQPERDLVSLCDGCGARARRGARTAGRALTRAEVAALDPHARLYDRGAIAELRARYELTD